MTGKDVVNFIQKLEAEGMTAEKIIEISNTLKQQNQRQK